MWGPGEKTPRLPDCEALRAEQTVDCNPQRVVAGAKRPATTSDSLVSIYHLVLHDIQNANNNYTVCINR